MTTDLESGSGTDKFVTAGSAARFGISIPADVARQLDNLAARSGRSRNAIVVELLRAAVASTTGGFSVQDWLGAALERARAAYAADVERVEADLSRARSLRVAIENEIAEATERIRELLERKRAALAGEIPVQDWLPDRPELVRLEGARAAAEGELALLDGEIASLEARRADLERTIRAAARDLLVEERWPAVCEALERAGTAFGTTLSQAMAFAKIVWPTTAGAEEKQGNRIFNYAIWRAISSITGDPGAGPLRRALLIHIGNKDAGWLQDGERLARVLAELSRPT